MAERIDEREMVADLRSVAAELGETPTAAQYADHGAFTAHTARRKFGRWQAFVDAADLDTRYPWRREDWLRERAESGAAAEKMADEAGTSVQTIRRWLAIYGVETEPPPGGPTSGLARRLWETDPEDVGP